MDSKLNFAAHLREKSATAKKGIGLIKLLRSYLPTNALNLIYKARVRSHLDYCDFIYHIPELDNKDKILESGRMTDIRLNYQMEKLGKSTGSGRASCDRNLEGHKPGQNK